MAKLELLAPLGQGGGPSGAQRGAASRNHSTVLYVGRKGGSLHHPRMGLSAEESSRLRAIRRRGFGVAVLDVCGFGTLGNGNRTTCTTVGGNATDGNVCRLPFAYKGTVYQHCTSVDNNGTAWCPTADGSRWGNCRCGGDDAFGLFELPSDAFRTQESGLVDVAFNLNRSIPGFHAADVVRAAVALATPGYLPGAAATTIVATVSTNDTAAAVLTAALVTAAGVPGPAPSPGGGTRRQGPTRALLGDVAVLSSVASWEMTVTSARYDMSAYYSFVYGGLAHFDLPDMLAALVAAPSSPPVRVMVGQPLDAQRRPLSRSAAEQAYGFARSVNATGVTLQARVGPQGLTAELLRWLGR